MVAAQQTDQVFDGLEVDFADLWLSASLLPAGKPEPRDDLTGVHSDPDDLDQDVEQMLRNFLDDPEGS